MTTQGAPAHHPALVAGRRAPGPAQHRSPRAPAGARSGAPREFSKFLVVGVAATAVSTALYNLFAHTAALGEGSFAQQPMAAFVLANLAGMVVSFFGTQWWVFSGRTHTGAAHGLSAFALVNVASWIIPLGSLAFSRYVLGLSSALADNVAANVVGLGVGTVVRFWALRATTSAKEQEPEPGSRAFAQPRLEANASEASPLRRPALAALPTHVGPRPCDERMATRCAA